MRRNILVTAIILATLAVPAAAKGVFYFCELDTKHAQNWVSSHMGFVLGGANGSSVVDGITLHYKGGPVRTRGRQNGNMVRLTWNIAGAEDVKKHTVATFSYEARLDVKTLAISVVANPVGYPQRFSAKGKCAIHKSARGFPRLKS